MNTLPDTTPAANDAGKGSPFSYRERLRGKRLIVIGGTGFLGKVWWSFLLHRVPDLGQIYLVVRSKPGLNSEARFWRDVAASESMEGLRAVYGDGLYDYFRQKITVIDGDITHPFCGITEAVRNQLRGKIDAVANASGIVDFQPPLDVALEVNAFGAQNLVALAKDLGQVPVMHTSTCYVSGYKTGIIEEENPLKHPFPFAGKLERAHWDPDREISECMDIVEQAKHRAGDAFRQSDFLAKAIVNLEERAEPATGRVLEDEIARVRRKFIEVQLAQLGLVRAQFWGWPNTYTYTKSIGEQIVARSGLGFCIVRPAIIESCVSFPQHGWNEGINTSAPLIYAIREGLAQLPGGPIRLDVIPCDMVAAGMTLALAELVGGEAKPVYQFGSGDSNPISMARIYELSGLYKRKYHQRSRKGPELVRFLQAHVEGALLTPDAFARFGPKAIAREANRIAALCDRTKDGALNTFLRPISKNLRAFARVQSKIGEVVLQFQPFTAELDYEFRCDNTRAALARLPGAERPDMCFTPESIEWRDWFLKTHVPGLERWVFPELEQRLKKRVKAQRVYDSVEGLLGQMASRFDLAVALEEVGSEGLSRVSYAELYALAQSAAQRLVRSGVRPGERVGLHGVGDAKWVIALFGILLAGAVAVPLDAGEALELQKQRVSRGQLRWLICRAEDTTLLGSGLPSLDELMLPADLGQALPEVSGDQAAIVWLGNTDGTASASEVCLLHMELTAGVAALGPLVALSALDKVVSLNAWRNGAELCCGLLLPLSRGSRVVLGTGTSLEGAQHALLTARASAVVGSSATVGQWARQLKASLAPKGRLSLLRRRGLSANQSLSRGTGLDVGRFVFRQLHQGLGGQLRLVLALGAGVDIDSKRFLAGLGLPVSDGFAVLGASAPLTLALGAFGSSGKTLGRAVPDVALRVVEPDALGFGEVWAKGASVAVSGAKADGGWLKTGHVGQLDDKGRLVLRANSRRADETRRTAQAGTGNGTNSHGSGDSHSAPRVVVPGSRGAALPNGNSIGANSISMSVNGKRRSTALVWRLLSNMKTRRTVTPRP